MAIHSVMKNAMHTKWALTDDFQFMFYNQRFPLISGFFGPGDMWDMCTISVDTPQMSANVNNVPVGGQYKTWISMQEPFSLSVTFRDIAGWGLKQYFQHIWMAQQKTYPDDIKSQIIVSVDGVIVFESKDVFISAVSQSQLTNNDTQVQEFTVEFISPFYTTSRIAKFGDYTTTSDIPNYGLEQGYYYEDY